MARYADKTVVEKHQVKAIADTLRYFAERYEEIAASMERGGVQVLETTHWKTLRTALDKIQSAALAAIAARDATMLAKVSGDSVSQKDVADMMARATDASDESVEHVSKASRKKTRDRATLDASPPTTANALERTHDPDEVEREGLAIVERNKKSKRESMKRSRK